MGQIGKIVAGAALIAGAVALDVASGGAAGVAGAEEFTAFLGIIGASGASLVASGTAGLLATPPPGHGVTSQNPIKAWDVAYGNVLVPGTFVYLESNGGILSNGSNTYDKANNQVVMLACHPIKSVDQVRLNGKVIPLGPGGSGAQSTTWSYSPASNQNQTNITSISRAGGVVTLKLVGPLTGQNGLQFNVQHVADNSFNGIFTVTQPNPTDASTFTYLCGGADGSSSGGYIYTCLADYKNRVHCDLTSCLGNHTSTFPELVNNSTLWTAAHKNLGKASVYMAYYYDATVFANGLPTSSFVIEGKNDIYDPRLGDVTNAAAHVYTTNAALIIADYLTNKTWGYGLSYGTDVPLTQLIAAANLCDETVPLAAGGTEAQYTINMHFDLTQSRGAVLQDMLNACAGRITIQSGQYIIIPGAWAGPSLSLTQANLIGPIQYKPILTITDSANGIKGTYSSAVSSWQPADIPPYCEDALHGYTADQWLAADGGIRIWKDVSFPATTSCPTSQRLAKIDLERLRREGRLTLHCNMSAYSAVALDVVDFTYPKYGWNNKTFEILSSKLVVQSDANGGAPVLGVDLDLAETDSTVYDWSDSEELTPADTPSPAINNGNILTGPQFLELESGPSTSIVGADGVVTPRILAAWLAAPDARIQSGGYIQVEYQKVGDTFWTSCGQVNGTQTECYILGVISGSQYNVQIQGFTANGASSGWVQAGPVTVSATATSIVASSIFYPDGTPVSNLEPAQAGADMTAAQALAYTGTSGQLVPNNNFILGNIEGWLGIQGVGGTYDGGDPSIYFAPSAASTSPSFGVVPGQTYMISYRAWYTAGTQSTYFRIAGNATYSPNVIPVSAAYYHDFLGAGSIDVGSKPGTTYSYSWTCPVGIYFASLSLYNNGTGEMACGSVACVPYNGVAQWGADVTLNNTAAAIVGQGTLATVNQVATANIVANAVNSQITAQTSSNVICPSSTTTPVANVTLGTSGGYVKVTCTLNIYGNGGSGNATVFLYKGAVGGTQLAQALDVTAPSASTGSSSVTVQAVDTSPGLAQQYTVAVTPNTSTGVVCIYSYLIAENAKV